MKMISKPLILFVIILVVSSALYYHTVIDTNDEMVLATTTSTYDSGLLDDIIGDFEKEYDIEVKIIAVGTGQALKLGENGDADVLLIHAPSKEKVFVEQGHGLYRKEVMYNQFVIVGPSSDPATITGLRNASTALARIFDTESSFASRGDDSGTNTKEKELWVSAGLDYDEISGSGNAEWYLSLGQGMGDTLRTASEMDAYTLTDEGTYYSLEDDLDLEIQVKGDPRLFNQYSVIPINATKHKGVDQGAAENFADWITTPKVQGMIDNFTAGGKILFIANGGE